ncbi:hypothetical protein OPKNFCMD_4086 [Methylobacterium crusticola]|uniref:HTH luxR-type domain-containing protein n=1 Tax=Methylobacterium crusticola TaxID=1697972 RepID=A0ABQ4R1I6_9HYPH|nr:helix-turn-helix transcriptional regulator [Methylobacterium crusticola]GJD51332.1 hypothetical protein OPKNFCMD_4086 [Methylobacterium crusticola]
MAGSRENRLGEVVDRFYEAALRPELWRTALHAYSEALGAEGALILPGPRAAVAPACSEGLDAVVSRGVDEGWFADNPRVTRGIPALKDTRGVLVESQIFTPRELDHLPFNADFVARSGFRWFAGIYLVASGQDSVMLSVERKPGQEPFSHREIAQIGRMLPHFQRAGEVALRLAETRASSILEAFELMRCGGLLLDGTGRVVGQNGRARAMGGRTLRVVQGTLVAHPAATNAALGRLIGSVIGRGPAHAAPAAPPVAVPREGGPPLVVHAAPLVASGQEPFRRARAVLLIRDPAEAGEVGDALLRQAFGLTAAEARLANALARGRDLAEVAAAGGTTVATLRSQLKAVFAKTGTHRQAELVALLVRMALPA